MTKRWKVEVIVCHRFDVEADSYDEAREEANHVIWDAMGIKVTRKKISITSQLMARWVRQLATGKSVHYVMRRKFMKS